MGVPFLALEFKGAKATVEEVRVEREQMEATMRHTTTERNVGQAIYGAVVWGTLCHFFVWKNGKATELNVQEHKLWKIAKVRGKALWNFAESEGRTKVNQYFQEIKSGSPLAFR